MERLTIEGAQPPGLKPLFTPRYRGTAPCAPGVRQVQVYDMLVAE